MTAKRPADDHLLCEDTLLYYLGNLFGSCLWVDWGDALAVCLRTDYRQNPSRPAYKSIVLRNFDELRLRDEKRFDCLQGEVLARFNDQGWYLCEEEGSKVLRHAGYTAKRSPHGIRTRTKVRTMYEEITTHEAFPEYDFDGG